MASLRTVLLFTYPEYGQANVVLATSYELALAGVNVCIASFASLETRVSRLQELVASHRDAGCSDGRPTGSVSFHECKGFTPFVEAVWKHGQDVNAFQHSHGVSGASKNHSMIDLSIFPWGPEEHLAGIESIKEVIATVKPDMVVIDMFFQIAIDACQLAGQKFIVLFPNSIKDAVATLQPCLSAFWKYPVIRLAIRMKTSGRVKQIQALRRSLGVIPRLPAEFYFGVTHICPALPETDFPFAIIPEEMVPCGPIIVPFDPVDKSDPALMKWLDNGPTVLINLGSHVGCDAKFAREMASSFRILLDYHDRKGTSKIQVLWKAMTSEDVRKPIDDIIGKEIEEGRVKVVSWLEAEPVAILQHPNMVCTVHHGGANSFFEGVWSGLPHVVLPVWADTYTYAARVEFLNIGIFGSKTSAPGVRAEELGQALVRVTGNTEEAGKFRAAAKRLKDVCRAKGDGRKLSAEAILKEMDISK